MSFTKKSVGFIILRHVNSEETNKYWQHSYECIRKFYPENNILIVDDNSNHEYLTNIKLYKTTIVYSEYTARGEILPYIYFLQYKISDIAVVVHDSVFINSLIDFDINDDYKFLWDFKHGTEEYDKILEENMINVFNDKELLDFYKDRSLWKGCFGVMTIISYDCLQFINKKYNLNLLINLILTREDRQAFERVFACLLIKTFNLPVLNLQSGIYNGVSNNSIFGDIYNYCPWGITFKEKHKYENLPIIKVWTGR